MLFIATAFAFLGLAIARNLGELRGFAWELRPGYLLLSLVAHVGVLLWGVRIWQLILRRFGIALSLREVARIWFISSVGRYIPGKIWQFVGVAHLGGAAGVPPIAALTSLAVQMGITLLAGALVAVYLLPPLPGVVGEASLSLLRWSAPLLLLLVHPRIISSALVLFTRVTRRPAADWRGRWVDGIWLLCLAIAAWLLYGAAFYLFLVSLVPLPASAVATVTAMNALAFLVGYAVFIAPAGLGAKEGALAALLATLLPLPVAAALAVAARLWTVAAEILPLPFLLRRSQPPETRNRAGAAENPYDGAGAR